MLDVYDSRVPGPWDEEELGKSSWSCPICGADLAFENLVDTTNGSYYVHEDGTEERIDGWIEPIVKERPPICTCDKCGDQHSGPIIYEIPTKENK